MRAAGAFARSRKTCAGRRTASNSGGELRSRWNQSSPRYDAARQWEPNSHPAGPTIQTCGRRYPCTRNESLEHALRALYDRIAAPDAGSLVAEKTTVLRRPATTRLSADANTCVVLGRSACGRREHPRNPRKICVRRASLHGRAAVIAIDGRRLPGIPKYRSGSQLVPRLQGGLTWPAVSVAR